MRLHVWLVAALFLAVAACAKKEAPEVKKEEAKKAEAPKPAEIKKEEPKAEEAKKEEPKADETKKEEAKKEEPAAEPEKKVEEPPKVEALPVVSEAMAVVDKAIAAQGGLDVLKAKASSFTYKSQGTFFGKPYTMVGYWRAPDRMVMDIDNAAMVMGYVGGECWSKMGDVVVDCMKEEAAYAVDSLLAAHWTTLYPLKEAGVKLEAAGEMVEETRAFTGVKVTKEDGSFPVTLWFDKETGLLAMSAYHGHFMMTEGAVETRLSDYKEIDGVKSPTKSIMIFEGKPVIVEEVTEQVFGPVDDAKFARPEMVVGQPKVRPVQEKTVAAVLHKGPYGTIHAAIGGLMGWMSQKSMMPMAGPALIFLKDPMTEKDPNLYETEVQVEVVLGGPAPGEENGMAVKTVPAGEIVAQVAVGAYDQVGPGYGNLAGWAAQNGYEIAGPAGMLTYNDPSQVPPEKLVSELFFPVKKKP